MLQSYQIPTIHLPRNEHIIEHYDQNGTIILKIKNLSILAGHEGEGRVINQRPVRVKSGRKRLAAAGWREERDEWHIIDTVTLSSIIRRR